MSCVICGKDEYLHKGDHNYEEAVEIGESNREKTISNEPPCLTEILLDVHRFPIRYAYKVSGKVLVEEMGEDNYMIPKYYGLTLTDLHCLYSALDAILTSKSLPGREAK